MKKWPEIFTCFFSIQRKSIEYCEIIFSLLLTCLYYHEKKNSPPKKLSMQKENKNLPSNIGEKKSTVKPGMEKDCWLYYNKPSEEQYS